MKQYTDEEVLNWVRSQIANFKGMATGFGWDAIQAQGKLIAIEKLSTEERIRIGRLNLEKIQEEGLYINQLPNTTV